MASEIYVENPVILADAPELSDAPTKGPARLSKDWKRNPHHQTNKPKSLSREAAL